MNEEDPEKPRCAAPALMADPEDCWVMEDCKYYNRLLQRCEYVKRKTIEMETAQKEDSQVKENEVRER